MRATGFIGHERHPADGDEIEPPGPVPHRWWWTIATISCVAAQFVITVVFPDQIWSMPAGMSALAAVCALITAAVTPRARGAKEVWRWWVVTIAFTIWALAWCAMALTQFQTEHQHEFLHLFYIPRQILFLMVLLPNAKEDHGWLLRSIDVGQTLLLAMLIVLIAWPAPFNSPVISTHQNSGFLLIALTAIAAFLTQRGHTRHLLAALSITLVTYTITSLMAPWVLLLLDIDRNSSVWVYGDAAFVFYALFLLWGNRSPVRSHQTALQRSLTHVPPLLLTAGLLIVAIEIGRGTTFGGAIVGILGLLLYAVRTTLLNNRYLTERDRLLAIEAKRAHALIDIVHEIRSPLGSVVLNASLLARSAQLPQPQGNWVDQIHKGGTRVTTLLNDILDLERLDAGLVDADLIECDPRTIAVDALAVVEGQARTFGVTLVPPPSLDGDHRVIADRGKLERVLVNLVTNAIRFTPAGGRVAITIETLDPLRTALTVTDTGSGISAAGQAVLFERFGHVGTPVNGIRGSGLGLSICRGLMNAMNGTLDITSEPGRGTRVVVILPSATAPRRL